MHKITCNFCINKLPTVCGDSFHVSECPIIYKRREEYIWKVWKFARITFLTLVNMKISVSWDTLWRFVEWCVSLHILVLLKHSRKCFQKMYIISVYLSCNWPNFLQNKTTKLDKVKYEVHAFCIHCITQIRAGSILISFFSSLGDLPKASETYSSRISIPWFLSWVAFLMIKH
jgi:hypothetical protein